MLSAISCSAICSQDGLRKNVIDKLNVLLGTPNDALGELDNLLFCLPSSNRQVILIRRLPISNAPQSR